MQVMTRIKHVDYLTSLCATCFAHVWCGWFAGKFQTLLFVAVGAPVYPAAFASEIQFDIVLALLFLHDHLRTFSGLMVAYV